MFGTTMFRSYSLSLYASAYAGSGDAIRREIGTNLALTMETRDSGDFERVFSQIMKEVWLHRTIHKKFS